MKYVLRQKFSNPELRKKLVNTKDEPLVFNFTGQFEPYKHEENTF